MIYDSLPADLLRSGVGVRREELRLVRVGAAPLMRIPRTESRLSKARKVQIGEIRTMAKRGNKRRGRKKKKANHGKRPNA
ncbi:hypothetical protein K8369_31555 [Streptomyces sp. PSKA30]|nr:hypothetical protein [Streptomyces sp. PSKA30]MBZ9643830.1 hypothetical protein [Streptomyces sp. PSKA30]